MRLPGIPHVVTDAHAILDENTAYWGRYMVRALLPLAGLILLGAYLSPHMDLVMFFGGWTIVGASFLGLLFRPYSTTRLNDASAILKTWESQREAWAKEVIQGATAEKTEVRAEARAHQRMKASLVNAGLRGSLRRR